MNKNKLFSFFIKDKEIKKSKEKYRIRTEELTSGFIKYYPEYHDGSLLSTFIPISLCWCTLEKDAKLIISLHKEYLIKERENIILTLVLLALFNKYKNRYKS